MLESNRAAAIKITFSTTADIDDKLNNGVLNKFYPSHPAVDFVGELQVGNDIYLKFFSTFSQQLSKTPQQGVAFTGKYDNFKKF